VFTSVNMGHAAAGIMSATTSLNARAAGLKSILNVAELRIPFLFSAGLSSPKVVREKNKAVTRFLRGYIEATALVCKDKETTIRSTGKFLKTSDREVLESAYEDYKTSFPGSL
jgi:hypothetical protein